MKNIIFLLAGICFGIILFKAEVVSWYRIQEMFQFHAFHMYGVIGTAVVTGAISVLILKRMNIKSIQGAELDLKTPTFHWGQVYGGLIFGFGWALTGACPGPLFVLVGSGFGVMLIALLFAIFGTWVYGALRQKLPH